MELIQERLHEPLSVSGQSPAWHGVHQVSQFEQLFVEMTDAGFCIRIIRPVERLADDRTVLDPVWQDHEISGPEGVKFDRIELLDLDQDGDQDVITCEERDNLGVIWYENPTR